MKINPDNELNALIEHIERNWDGFDKHEVSNVINTIWSQALPATKYYAPADNLIDIIQQWNKERNDYSNWVKAGTDMTQEQFMELRPLDAFNKLMMWLIMGPMEIQSAFSEKWDYEKVCNDIISELKINFPSIAKVKPKGWLKLSKNYSSYDGMDDYLKNQKLIDQKEFKGINSGTATTHNFPTRVALPYVMYNAKDQGVTALETLVGSIVAHAYEISGQNNNADLIKDITLLKDTYSTNENYKDILLSMDLKETLTSPVGRALTVIMEHEITWTTKEKLNQVRNKLPQPDKNEESIEEDNLVLGSEKSKQKIASMLLNMDTKTTVLVDKKEDKQLLKQKILEAFDVVIPTKKLKM